MTNEEIIQRGQLINDETEPAQNTSERVGGVIKGIGQNLADKDTAIAAEAARNGYYQCTVNNNQLAVTAPGFTLPAHGGNIRIKMSAPATGACTLNINSTGPKELLYNGAAVSSTNTWEQNEIISVYYDGTNYQATNSQGGGGKAEKIKYDNVQSGLASDNTQGALDEIGETLIYKEEIVTNTISTLERAISKTTGEWTGNGTVSTNRHIRIPVTVGETYILTASNSLNCDYAWLYDNADARGGDQAHLVSGTSVVNVLAGQTVSMVAPATAKYMYIRTNAGSTTPTYPAYLGTKGSVIENLSKRFIPWISGKKVSIMGNSRCTFDGFIPSGNATKYPYGDVLDVRQTWWWMVLNALGAELELNDSYSGGRVASGTTTAQNNVSFVKNYFKRHLVIDKTDVTDHPDVVFLWGGINDLRNNYNIGTLDYDTEYSDTLATLYTQTQDYAPALNYLVKSIRTDHPNAYIVMFVEDCLSFNDDWVQVVYDIANHYPVKRWETNGESGANGGGVLGVVDLSNLTGSATRADSLHYDAAGMQTVASEVLAKLSTLGSEDVDSRINMQNMERLDKVIQNCCVSETEGEPVVSSMTITKDSEVQSFIAYPFERGKRYRITVDFGNYLAGSTMPYAMYLYMDDTNYASDTDSVKYKWRTRDIIRTIMPSEVKSAGIVVTEFTSKYSLPWLECYVHRSTTGTTGSTVNVKIEKLDDIVGSTTMIKENIDVVWNFDGWDKDGTWTVNNGSAGLVFPVKALNTSVIITSGSNNCYYAFWKEYQTPVNSEEISCYCDGYERSSISAGRTKIVPVPSDCKYIYIGMSNGTNSYAPASVSIRYDVNDRIEQSDSVADYPFVYNGGRLNLSDYCLSTRCKSEILPFSNIGAYSNKTQQSLAIYGDYAFSFYDTGYVKIYHIPSNTWIVSFLMADTISGANNHCGNANFGSQFYVEGDVFPCLYVSSYGEYKAYVIRIVPTGTGNNGLYTFDATSITLVQSIVGASSWGIHFYPDGDKLLVHKNNSFDQHYYVFDMPLVSAGDITLNPSNAKDEFTFNIGLNQAGAVARNGKIFANMYSSTSGHDTKRSILIYDYIRKSVFASVLSPLYAMRSYEVEGIEIYDGAIWTSHNGGNFIGKIMIK